MIEAERAFAAQLRAALYQADERSVLSPADATDLARHLRGRFNDFRRHEIGWLRSAMDLTGASVLDLGCGTGSVTAALALEGAAVDAVEDRADLIALAASRCAWLGAEGVRFQRVHPVEMVHFELVYDLIMLGTIVEHLSFEQRGRLLQQAWQGLKPGGLLAILGCANRLWNLDEPVSVNPMALDLTMPAAQVLPGLMDHRRAGDTALDEWWRMSADNDPTFRRSLLRATPSMPSAFAYPTLNVLLRKTD